MLRLRTPLEVVLLIGATYITLVLAHPVQNETHFHTLKTAEERNLTLEELEEGEKSAAMAKAILHNMLAQFRNYKLKGYKVPNQAFAGRGTQADWSRTIAADGSSKDNENYDYDDEDEDARAMRRKPKPSNGTRNSTGKVSSNTRSGWARPIGGRAVGDGEDEFAVVTETSLPATTQPTAEETGTTEAPDTLIFVDNGTGIMGGGPRETDIVKGSQELTEDGLLDNLKWEKLIWYIEENYSDSEYQLIRETLEFAHRIIPCVSMRILRGPTDTRPAEEKFIEFRKHPVACSSQVGRHSSQQQFINLAQQCVNRGGILHEIAHTLGFSHEEDRPLEDRNGKAETLWHNIKPENHKNKEGQTNVARLLEYDPWSIVHFNHHNAGKIDPSGATLKLKNDPGPSQPIGSKGELTELDMAKWRLLYCPNSHISKPGCKKELPKKQT